MRDALRTLVSIAGMMTLGVVMNPAVAQVSMLKNFDFDKPAFVHAHEFAKRHVVLQVSQNDPKIWELVLNNTQNLVTFFDSEEIQVVVVAYGPGLRMLFADSPMAQRIQSLDRNGVEFDACNNTLEGMTRAMGHKPDLLPESVLVPAGVVRIMQ
jgi:hypothetical protein